MPRVSAAFFAVATLCLLIGMTWGIVMGASENMVTMPAHAHLNLLGWVTLSIYGSFYALTKERLKPKLAWANFFASSAGVVILIPVLALFLAGGNNPKFIPLLMVGELLSVLGVLIFGVSVVRELLRARA